MNPKAKKLTTGVLALTAVAIWVPQILTGVVQKAPTPRPERDDSEDFDDESGAYFEEDEGYDEFDDFGYSGNTEEMSDEEWAPHPSSGSLANQLEQTTERLRAFGGPQRVDLDQLLTSFQAQSNATRQTATSTTSALPVTTSSGSLALQLASDALDQLAHEQPLTAIIHGDSDTLAMLGGRIVRVGDELSPGIRVTDIKPRRVRIEGGANSRWLELVPFRTRPAFADEDASDEEELGTSSSTIGSDLRYFPASDALATPISITPVPEDAAPETSNEND